MDELVTTTHLNGALEGAFAGGVNVLTGCGSGMFIMLLVAAVSIGFNFYLLRCLVALLKDGISAMTALKEAIHDVIRAKD